MRELSEVGSIRIATGDRPVNAAKGVLRLIEVRKDGNNGFEIFYG